MNRFLFGVQEELGLIETALYPYLGMASKYNNYAPLIELVIDTIIQRDSHHPVMHFIIGYNIPSEIAEDLAVELRSNIMVTLQRCIGVSSIPDDHTYHYKVYSAGDVEFMDLGVDRRSQALELERQMEEHLMESIERGDYIPERMRRLVGG